MNATLIYLISALAVSAQGADLNLAWDDNNVPPVDFFTLKWGKDCNTFTNSVQVPGTQRFYTVKGIDPTIKWCFTVSASRGTEVSPNSNLLTPFLVGVAPTWKGKIGFSTPQKLTYFTNGTIVNTKVTLTNKKTGSVWSDFITIDGTPQVGLVPWPSAGYYTMSVDTASSTGEHMTQTLPDVFQVYPVSNFTVSPGSTTYSCKLTDTSLGSPTSSIWASPDNNTIKVGPTSELTFTGPTSMWVAQYSLYRDLSGNNTHKKVVVTANSCAVDPLAVW